MKKLKKNIAMLMMMCFVIISLCACGDSKPNGRYDLYGLEENGEMQLLEDLIHELEADGFDYDMTAYIEFNSDNTGRIYMLDELDEQFTWDENNIYVDGDPTPYTFDDGKISISDFDETGAARKMVFSK